MSYANLLELFKAIDDETADAALGSLREMFDYTYDTRLTECKLTVDAVIRLLTMNQYERWSTRKDRSPMTFSKDWKWVKKSLMAGLFYDMSLEERAAFMVNMTAASGFEPVRQLMDAVSHIQTDQPNDLDYPFYSELKTALNYMYCPAWLCTPFEREQYEQLPVSITLVRRKKIYCDVYFSKDNLKFSSINWKVIRPPSDSAPNKVTHRELIKQPKPDTLTIRGIDPTRDVCKFIIETGELSQSDYELLLDRLHMYGTIR